MFPQSLFFQSVFFKVIFSKVYFCKMYLTYVSSKLCEFIGLIKLIKFMQVLHCNACQALHTGTPPDSSSPSPPPPRYHLPEARKKISGNIKTLCVCKEGFINIKHFLYPYRLHRPKSCQIWQCLIHSPLDRLIKTFFWNFKQCQMVLYSLSLYEQKLEKTFCSNVAPS